MAVLKKPATGLRDSTETIGNSDLASKIQRKLEQKLAADSAAESPPSLKVQRTLPQMKPRRAPNGEIEKKRGVSPLSAGLSSIKFIQRKCQDIPSLIRPSALLKKRGGDKEEQQVVAMTAPTSPEPQALFAEAQMVSLEAQTVTFEAQTVSLEAGATLFGTETVSFEAQTSFAGPESISFGGEKPAPEIKPMPLERQIAADEPPPSREAVSSRPLDQEKVGYVSPSYTMSRAVTLNPQTMLANRCVGFQQDSPELESYRVLRARILQRSKGTGNTIMVTSALPGEGKTLTAINLAFTFAKEFRQTALLVDCDLRRQQVHKVLGFQSEKGVADYLLDDCPLRDLFVWPGVEKLSIISGGKTVTDSSELLGSPGMRNLVIEMKNRYAERYVFFDVPPLLTCADPMAFAPLVDFIIVAVHAGSTPLQDVNRALSLLPSEKVLGLVMNRQDMVMKPYGYPEKSVNRLKADKSRPIG